MRILRGMGYILYGDPGSGAAAAEMALAEADQPVEWRDVSLDGDRQRGADYLAVNPMGRVPAMILPDGTVLTESLAILLTVTDRHPEAALLPPPGDAGRARALRWMALLAGEFYPHVTRHDYPERFGAAPSQSGRLRRRAQEMGREVLRLIETHAGLTGDPAAPFLLGARFTAADIYLAVLSRWMDGRVWTPANLPKIEALTRAVAARPAIAPLWHRHRFAPD